MSDSITFAAVIEAARELTQERDKLRKQLEKMTKNADFFQGQYHSARFANDGLSKLLEIAGKSIKAFLERFDDESDNNMDSTIYVIEGLRNAFAEIEKFKS